MVRGKKIWTDIHEAVKFADAHGVELIVTDQREEGDHRTSRSAAAVLDYTLKCQDIAVRFNVRGDGQFHTSVGGHPVPNQYGKDVDTVRRVFGVNPSEQSRDEIIRSVVCTLAHGAYTGTRDRLYAILFRVKAQAAGAARRAVEVLDAELAELAEEIEAKDAWGVYVDAEKAGDHVLAEDSDDA
jgi:hypothetical protein